MTQDQSDRPINEFTASFHRWCQNQIGEIVELSWIIFTFKVWNKFIKRIGEQGTGYASWTGFKWVADECLRSCTWFRQVDGRCVASENGSSDLSLRDSSPMSWASGVRDSLALVTYELLITIWKSNRIKLELLFFVDRSPTEIYSYFLYLLHDVHNFLVHFMKRNL